MTIRTLLALGLAAFTVACSSDPSGTDIGDGAPPSLDAAGGDGGPVSPDDGGADSGPDTVAPMAIVDLAATAIDHTSIHLTWTAPTDAPSGKAALYEVRRSKTPIASNTDFDAAAVLNLPAPKAGGTPETFDATGLEAETTYYFAIKAKDAAGNTGPMSNVASATTKARAKILLSEVAMSNPAGTDGSPGFDFVEIVVTKAGTLKGVEVKQSGSPTSLYTFADLDVAVDDRLVVHLTGIPGPTGYVQEDAAKSKTASTETAAFGSSGAYDVYSGVTGLPATDNLVTVRDGATVLDAVAYSLRDGDASSASMTAFATAKSDGSWTFGVTPVDATNDCETQRDAVAISTSFGSGNTAGTCGRFATGMGAQKSINRVGTTDTGSKKDWYVAAQTPGAANTAIVAPKLVSTVSTSLTTVDLRFDQEMDGATVTLGAFTGSGITISAAALGDASFVTLTTSTQGGPHSVGVDSTVKSIYGMAVDGATLPARFCGYEPLGGMVVLTEINPNIPGADLVELEATRAGSVGGFGVRENPTAASSGNLVVSFPAGFCVALGDIVVVHMEPAALPNETISKSEGSDPSYYTDAWDLRGGAGGLVATDSVIAVRDAANNYVDAVVLTNASGTTTAGFQTSLAYIQSLGLWTPADCGGAACDDASTPTAEGVAASRAGVGTTPGGSSLRRASAASASTAASWTVGASSWGVTN